MRELLISLPFDAQAGAPVFPASLVEANPANPVSDGTPGDRWQTECYTPTDGKCLVRAWTASEAIADALAEEGDLSALLVDGAVDVTAVRAALADVYADDVIKYATDGATSAADVRAKLQEANTRTPWAVGLRVAVDEVYYYARNLYQVIQAHTTQGDWTPDVTPALWKRFYEPTDGPQPWVQPTGAHDAYAKGDRVTFNGNIYESKINANVWSPTVYPAGWTLIGPA